MLQDVQSLLKGPLLVGLILHLSYKSMEVLQQLMIAKGSEQGLGLKKIALT